MHEAFHLLVLKLLFVNSHLASIILEDGGGSTGGIGVNLRQLKPWAIKQGISLNAATLILQLAGFWGAFIFSAGSIRIAQLVESRKIRFKNHIQRALVIAAVSSLIISSLYASITEKGSDMYYVELIGVILKMEWLVLSFQSSCWIMAMWGFVQYYKMDQWFSSRHLYRQFISSRA
jgi:hypothetical protein